MKTVIISVDQNNGRIWHRKLFFKTDRNFSSPSTNKMSIVCRKIDYLVNVIPVCNYFNEFNIIVFCHDDILNKAS